jgi:hypothetical protein
MTYRLYSFVKFFEKEKYADDFISGKLFCNTLRYFRDLEEKSDGRGDSYEGATALIQPKGKIVKFTPVDGGNPFELREEDFSGPILVHTDENLSHRIFCMYAIYIDDSFAEFSDEEVSDEEVAKRIASVNNKMKLHEECFNMGRHAVWIYDVEPFVKALEACENANRIKVRKGLVKYYDGTSFDGDFKEDEAIFHKQEKFSHQKEYRLAFKPFSDSPFLEIGSMENYAKKMSADEVRKLEIQVLPNELV